MYYPDKETDEKLLKLENRIKRMYGRAYTEMKATANDYFDKFVDRYLQEYDAYQKGKYTDAEFKAWVQTQVQRGKGYEAFRDKLAQRMTDANILASKYINDATPSIYSLNRNYEAYRIDQAFPDFQLTDEMTVRRLMGNDNHIEFKSTGVNRIKDYEWNRKQIHSALTAGILQGKSIDKLADSYMVVMKRNRNSAIRNARTSFTSAQNAGRMEAYYRAENMGITLDKEWIATQDARTRDSHASLDGERVPYNDIFSNGLRYPADPEGAPAEVYNCRCTTRAILPKINDGKRKTYKEWLEENTPETEAKEVNKLIEEKPESYIVQDLVKPVRPLKSEYEDYDKYLEDREKYRAEKAIYDEKLQAYIDSENNKPRNYDTQEKVEAWAKKNNIRVDKNVYDSIDLRIMDDVISVQEEMLAKYPYIKEHQDKYYPYGISYEGESSYLFSAGRGLIFGREWTDYNNLVYSIDSLNDGTFTHGDGSIKTLLRHEFGHNVDSYIRMTQFSTLDLRGDDPETKRRSELLHNYENELRTLTKKHCKTEYAYTNELEAFAEGFTEYSSNPNSEYGKAFGEFLTRWL